MNNIELLKNYVDKEGRDITTISFSSGKYLCSYSNGEKIFLTKEQIFDKKPEIKIVEPEYFEEQLFDFDEPIEDVLFSNEGAIEKEENLEDDFFKDFL